MPGVILVDTFCLILLDKIGKTDLLQKLFDKIVVTPAVVKEFSSPLPKWIHVSSPKDAATVSFLRKTLGAGEASLIALGLETEDPLLIIDEFRGRRTARHLGIAITGVLGLFIEAKHKGHIENIKPYLEMVRQTNFRIDAKLEQELLLLAGET